MATLARIFRKLAMRPFFSVYQYLGPIIFLPLAYWLWFGQSGRHDFVALVLVVPILFQYVLPAIGTNVLKLWEINARLRLGNFRPHHGFVFGTATSVMAFLAIGAPGPVWSAGEAARAAFVMGSVLGFWNWLYDMYAIRSGHINVYTQPFRDGLGPEAIAADHAPVYFGTFGFCYGLAVYTGQVLLVSQGRSELFWPLLASAVVATLVLPAAAYIGHSYLHHGHNGLESFRELRTVVPEVQVVELEHLTETSHRTGRT